MTFLLRLSNIWTLKNVQKPYNFESEGGAQDVFLTKPFGNTGCSAIDNRCKILTWLNLIIFCDVVFRLKGSDASWEHDEEPPQEVNIVNKYTNLFYNDWSWSKIL